MKKPSTSTEKFESFRIKTYSEKQLKLIAGGTTDPVNNCSSNTDADCTQTCSLSMDIDYDY